MCTKLTHYHTSYSNLRPRKCVPSIQSPRKVFNTVAPVMAMYCVSKECPMLEVTQCIVITGAKVLNTCTRRLNARHTLREV